MKKKLLTIILAILCLSINAQEWTKNIKTSKPNFFEIQKAFNDYQKDNETELKSSTSNNKEKDGDYEKFKRWEWYWKQRVDNGGNFPESDVLVKENEKYTTKNINKAPEAIESNANWSFYGPNVTLPNTAGITGGIGRINCIAFHPTIPTTFWVGTPAGGLWKTTDGGTTWATNTDHLPVLGISDIAIDPTNPSIMYIATGDGEGALSLPNGAGDTKSIGVLKSTDGGNTWNVTGLNWNVTSSKLIRRLVMSPVYPQELTAATSDGLYRTLNGGTTWTQVQAGYFMDVEYKPNNSDTLYASTYNSGGNAKIYRSTNYGTSWAVVTTITDAIRINLTVSASLPNEVDALCANTSSGLEGLWYSVDNGGSFTQYFVGSSSNNLLNNSVDASGVDGQGFYDLAYAMNPSDYNDIWLGGVNTWHTADGGSNWLLNNYWISGTSTPVVHADKHFLAFHPLNNSFLYECNDGGLYETNDSGTNWYNLTNGMGISEIYRIGTSATIANDVICGLQDNGSKELYGGSWYSQTGGDGTECLIDYANNNIEYATYVEGLIYKTTDGGTNWVTIVDVPKDASGNPIGTGVNEAGDWVTPYIMHPTDHNTLLVGKSQVYQTTDGGTNWAQIGTITGATGNIIAMAYAPSNPSTIYVATRLELFKTINGGSTWSLIRTSTDKITYIAVSPTDPNFVYYTNSGYTAGSKVWGSSNGGASWLNYSGTLPNVPVNTIVYQNGTNEVLYVGTDLGVYYTNATMSDWIQYNTGLPNVVVNELEISYVNNKLWAATFGRGLWSSDLNTLGVGIQNMQSVSNSYKIYPNPSSGNFTISQSLLDKSNIEIYNVVGEKIYQTQMINQQTTIDLSLQSKGVYFVKITDDKNNVSNKKIVIQ
jgi:photosystem II stability/assembly factor-like uncharacterized protein